MAALLDAVVGELVALGVGANGEQPKVATAQLNKLNQEGVGNALLDDAPLHALQHDPLFFRHFHRFNIFNC